LSGIEQLCAQAVRGLDCRHARRITEHQLAQLVCLGTHTVSGLLSTCGHQFRDWSAAYRMYERGRVSPERLFEPVRQWLCKNQDGAVVMAMDDTRTKKSGRKTHGVKYMRDPMGPPFRVNFILAQRFLQTSMALKGKQGEARMIPVDWVHAPLPVKPGARASEQEWEVYEAESKKCRISVLGANRIMHMRSWLDEHGAKERRLWTVVDGSFTNGTVIKHLPQNTTLTGRIRADAKLYYLPKQQRDRGRRRVYGDRAPTPEQLRQDTTVPWQECEVFFGGKLRKLRVKHLGPLRWRTAGQHYNLQLIVIAPTAYRNTKNGKRLYRKPAYLICTDPNATIKEVIQHYLWRWDIEVNFRDQKTLLGVGEAQVRTPKAVQNVTGCQVAAYAMLLTAAAQCQKQNDTFLHLPRAKWQRKKSYRPTTMRLIQNLRAELWTQSIHFSSFDIQQQTNTKPEKYQINLESALLYATSYS